MLRTLLSILILIWLPFLGVSQDWSSIESNDKVLTELKGALNSMKSIKGNIRQEKSFAFLNDKLVSTGNFVYKKDDKLRWDFSEPIEYIILINENSMRLKEEGEEKKYKGVNKILRQVKEIILGCVDGSIMSNPSYKTSFASNGSSVKIQLQPKAKQLKEFIQQIDVQFTLDNSVLQQVTLTDPSGDQTEIYFSNVKTNEPIKESVFTQF